jgi:hypothetical protein
MCLEAQLTKRGTPSGSPILMTVCSCLARDEPEPILALCLLNPTTHAKYSALVATEIVRAQTDILHRSRKIILIIAEKVNSLSKLGLRSWPYFVGVEVGAVEGWFLGVRGETE